jgi:hypothetical protein
VCIKIGADQAISLAIDTMDVSQTSNAGGFLGLTRWADCRNREAAVQVARDPPQSGRHMPSANGEIRYSL